jgi:hypothetical protein
MGAEKATWKALGCPKEIGTYRLSGADIRVRKIHIIAAEDNPEALFTVVAFHPPVGRQELMLGHRID